MTHATERADRFAQRIVDRHHKALASQPDPHPEVSVIPKPEGEMTLAEVQAALKRVQAMRRK